MDLSTRLVQDCGLSCTTLRRNSKGWKRVPVSLELPDKLIQVLCCLPSVVKSPFLGEDSLSTDRDTITGKVMCWKIVEVIAGVFTAIGTISVAIFAIWGDFFRYKLAGPQLSLS